MRKLITFALMLPIFAAAQTATAIRFVIGEMHTTYEMPKHDNFCMGASLDRTFNERLTFSLDVTVDVTHSAKGGFQQVSFSDGAYRVVYEVNPRLTNVTYHTEYALGDDDGTHAYIGTFIGVSLLRQTWQLEYVQDPYGGWSSSTSNIYPPTMKISKTLVPFGIRFGIRGRTEGGFADLYSMVGYQIGGGTALVDRAGFPATGDYLKTLPVYVTFGLSYGFGW